MSSRPPAGARSDPGTRTLAVLIDHVDHLGSGYETELRTALLRACQEFDLDLWLVVGRAVAPPDSWSLPHNQVYRLVDLESVDGVVMFSAGLATYCGEEGIRPFAARFAPLPMCSVGMVVPGVPSVVADNRSGMEAVVEHLVVYHGCRRVAFIGGPRMNPDADARLEAYRRVLSQHGLAADPELVAFADFTIPTGAEATHRLLERGVRFDALVAANDGMALGALNALGQHGLRVPRDVRVAGFDDLPLARLCDPPLTTARQRLHEMARRAVSLVVDQIQGRAVADCTALPIQLVTRKSCGCGARREQRNCPPGPPLSPLAFLRERRADLVTLLGEQVRLPGASSGACVARLVGALETELEGQAGAFSDCLGELVHGAADSHALLDELGALITILRDELAQAANPALEELWHSARCATAWAGACKHVNERLDLESTYQRLLGCGERFASSLDRSRLERVLGEELPRLHIADALVALARGEPDRTLEPFFCMRSGVVRDPPDPRLSAGRLVRASMQCEGEHYLAFILPLTFEAEYLGVAAFKMRPGLGVYDMLREQISFGLKTLALHAEIVEQSALHARSVQERVATTERMNSLRLLAGGVAHDLNNILGPLVALPDIIRRDLDRLGIAQEQDVRRLRSYLEAIKSAGIQATQTAKDLIMLGRQGQAPMGSLDLNRTVASCVTAEPLLVMERERGKIEVSVALCPKPLVIHACQIHLERAIANLVRNAAEAIQQSGRISITTHRACLKQPLQGYETIGPGNYGVVAVSDTGEGIPPDEVAHVFEPFFSKKPPRGHAGSGLGLFIVQGVVKEHSGFVDVRSSVGLGTTFTLYFPLASET